MTPLEKALTKAGKTVEDLAKKLHLREETPSGYDEYGAVKNMLSQSLSDLALAMHEQEVERLRKEEKTMLEINELNQGLSGLGGALTIISDSIEYHLSAINSIKKQK